MSKLRSSNITKCFFSFDEKCRLLFDKSHFTHPLYEKVILPLEAAVFKMDNYKYAPTFKKEFIESKKIYLKDVKNSDELEKIKYDLLKAHISVRMNNDEYFIYDFYNQDYWQRREWLTDRERLSSLMEKYGQSVYDELKDKSYFYQLTKQFFKREVNFIGDTYPIETFVQFTFNHPRFIVKPIKGSLGADTFITSVESVEDAKKLFLELASKGTWIVEELIQQHKAMAEWNESSVNTLRIPSFRLKDGCHILQPFLRTGRKGSVVDNAGHGGVFAVFDVDSGVITTDGVDEHGGRYRCHPDSKITFKGWKIPRYEELKAVVREVHHALPLHHRYVGFDFALTDEGWVLIEGNWGQMVGQMAELKGIRRQFIEYIS